MPAELVADFLESFAVHPLNFDFQGDSIAEFLRAEASTANGLSKWTVALPTAGDATPVSLQALQQDVSTSRRGVVLNTGDGSLLVSGKSARVGGRSDLRHAFRRGELPDRSATEDQVREVMRHPLLVTYLLRGVQKPPRGSGEEPKPYLGGAVLPALGLHFPGVPEAGGLRRTVRYRLNRVAQRQLLDSEFGDDDALSDELEVSRIEDLWASMQEQGVPAQRRITAEHACDLYADFSPPDQVGLVAISTDRPTLPPQMRAISVERGERSDGRASLRLVLDAPHAAPRLRCPMPGYRYLNRNRGGIRSVGINRLGQTTAMAVAAGATPPDCPSSTLRGLIGELIVLETRLLPAMPEREAVHAWRGPLGAAQDFLLSDGQRIEVKAIDRDADTVTVNGLAQLDPGPDELTLAVVRLQATGPTADGAVTATSLVARLGIGSWPTPKR